MIVETGYTRRMFTSWDDLEDYETDFGEDIEDGTIIVAGELWILEQDTPHEPD